MLAVGEHIRQNTRILEVIWSCWLWLHAWAWSGQFVCSGDRVPPFHLQFLEYYMDWLDGAWADVSLVPSDEAGMHLVEHCLSSSPCERFVRMRQFCLRWFLSLSLWKRPAWATDA